MTRKIHTTLETMVHSSARKQYGFLLRPGVTSFVKRVSRRKERRLSDAEIVSAQRDAYDAQDPDLVDLPDAEDYGHAIASGVCLFCECSAYKIFMYGIECVPRDFIHFTTETEEKNLG